MSEFTIGDFDNALAKDKKFRKEYEKWLAFEKWLSSQLLWLQEEVDRKCREKLKEFTK